MKHASRLYVAMLASWLFCSFSCAATVLTYGSPYGPNQTFSKADKTWIAWIEANSGGALKIRPIWSGALISADQSLLELRHGVADVGMISPIYAHGGAHLLRVQTGFYSGAKTYDQQVALYRCLAQSSPQFARELDGLVVLAVQGGALPGVLTRTHPIGKIDDLKGLRIRVPSELVTVLRDIGADPVSMPMGEVYSSLAKGVLDGVVAPAETLMNLHFGEVAKYYTTLEVPRGAYPARAMGQRRWAALSDAERAVLQASIPVWEAALRKETDAANQSGATEARHQGVVFVPISPTEQKKFDDLYEQDSARDADSLRRFGIDGATVFQRARGIARGIERDGKVECERGNDAAS
jgi:TRAP-type transport system periplasmic protein